MKNIQFLSPKTHKTLFKINLSAFKHNLNYYKNLLKPKTKLIVMVKAFAYGLGLSKISEVLNEEKVDYLAVAYTDEAVQLRLAGYEGKLMVFNPEPPCFDNIIRYQIEPEVYSLSLLKDYLEVLQSNGAYQLLGELPIHIKIDTGMHRLGMMEEDLNEASKLIKENNQLKVESVFTHLAAADEESMDNFTLSQIEKFELLYQKLVVGFGYQPMKHVLNSSGIERFGNYQMDMVRLGIGLYGFSPNQITEGKLQIVCSLFSHIAQIKKVKKGEAIGYNRSKIAENDMEIAIVFLGYADGLSRSLSNKGGLYLNGGMAPIVGNVSMDITVLDISNITCKVGDVVEVFGEHFTLAQFSEMAGTIPYEVLTDISSRVRRIYS